MDWTDRRERLRAILAGGRCIHPGSVHDPISARIAEDLGFEAGMFAGSVASLTVLGAPDIVVLTLTEFAQQAYRINRAGKLPLLVDADHGYGNALNVVRTVREYERAGVAAIQLEDQTFPKRCGHLSGKQVVEPEVMAAHPQVHDAGHGTNRAAAANPPRCLRQWPWRVDRVLGRQPADGRAAPRARALIAALNAASADR